MSENALCSTLYLFKLLIFLVLFIWSFSGIHPVFLLHTSFSLSANCLGVWDTSVLRYQPLHADTESLALIQMLTSSTSPLASFTFFPPTLEKVSCWRNATLIIRSARVRVRVRVRGRQLEFCCSIVFIVSCVNRSIGYGSMKRKT